MKKLGLVGGMGPESTIPYYHDIVYGVQKRLGRQIFPNMTMESLDVFRVLSLCKEEKYDELTEYLLGALNHLKAAGADFGALAANTPHIVFDRLKELSPIPLLSIVEVTAEEAERRGLKKIGLIGTAFTMQQEFFKKPFQEKKIEIIVPKGEQMEYVHQKISSELELGIVNPNTLEGFQKIIQQMKEQEQIQAVVLGCTELPMLLNDNVSPVTCLDTMQIHIQAIIDEILKE